MQRWLDLVATQIIYSTSHGGSETGTSQGPDEPLRSQAECFGFRRLDPYVDMGSDQDAEDVPWRSGMAAEIRPGGVSSQGLEERRKKRRHKRGEQGPDGSIRHV